MLVVLMVLPQKFNIFDALYRAANYSKKLQCLANTNPEPVHTNLLIRIM